MPRANTSLPCLLMLAALLFARTTAAQMTIHVEGIPDRLAFPLEEGTNVVLTVMVEGGGIESVWLARSAGSRERLALAAAGGGRYQINLADPRVVDLLRSAAGGQFQILARSTAGQTVASVPIRYGMRHAALRAPRFSVLTRDQRHVLGDDGRSTGSWFAPEEVEAIEVWFDERVASPSVELLVGRERRPIVAPDGATSLALPLTAELRALWKQHDTLIVQHDPFVRGGRVALRAVPERLDFPGTSVTLIVQQFQARELPGSHGFVRVHLDDIAAWRTLLTLTTARPTILLDTAPARRGDVFPFAFGREQYRLTVERLVNRLFGNDFALLRIERLAPVRPK